jgi:hypothetical protein
VRSVQLSDHPGELLQQARRRRDPEAERERRRYEKILAQHQERVDLARRGRDQARAQRRWRAWLSGILAVRRERRHAPAPPAAARQPGQVSGQEASLAAGVEGERLAAAGLGRALTDEWTLLRGYRNRRGEIDLLLLGPRGLFAIEVKHYNATVSCDGDRWWADRYDNYGNFREREPMADHGGRSPSVQLSQPADLLEDFLRSRGHQVTIQRAVLLTHPRARVGNCTGPTVRVAAATRDIVAWAQSFPRAIPDEDLPRLTQRIVHDHEHYQSRRRR